MKVKKYFFFLILLFTLFFNYQQYNQEEKKYLKQQSSIKIKKEEITNVLNNKSFIVPELGKKITKPKYTFQGIGLLVLPNGIKLNIKEDSSQKTLDSLAVGLLNISDKLNSKKGVIVIAGHNMKRVFSSLHIIKKNDHILIYTNSNIQTYQVVRKKVIKDTDFSEFKKRDVKTLYLITCTNSSNHRLLVEARLKSLEKLS